MSHKSDTSTPGDDSFEFDSSDTFEEPNQDLIDSCKDDMGRSTWTFLHTIAATNYPDRPSAMQRLLMRGLIRAIVAFFPCPECVEDFQEDCRRHPPRLESRQSLCYWMCMRHNHVNKRLGKKLINCDDMWKRWNYHTRYVEGEDYVEREGDCYGCHSKFGRHYEEVKKKFRL